jgi:hypothetical protein
VAIAFTARLIAWRALDPLVVSGNAALETGNALLLRCGAQRPHLFRIPGAGVIVSAHASGIHRAPQQFIDRHTEHFSADVPKRLVYPGDGGTHHRASAVKTVDVHGLPVMFHLHGVAADEELAKVLDAVHHGGGFPFQRAFAPAHHAGIGLELHEHVRAVGIRGEGDAEDLQPGDLDFGPNILERIAPQGVLEHGGASADLRGGNGGSGQSSGDGS